MLCNEPAMGKGISLWVLLHEAALTGIWALIPPHGHAMKTVGGSCLLAKINLGRCNIESSEQRIAK